MKGSRLAAPSFLHALHPLLQSFRSSFFSPIAAPKTHDATKSVVLRRRALALFPFSFPPPLKKRFLR